MKRASILALAAIFLFPALLPSLSSSGAAAQAADPIQEIRQQYAAINRRQKRYKRVKKQLSGFSLEGGELVAYFDGPSIVKIVANHYGEGGSAVEEYYFSRDQLLFVFRKDQRYDRPLSGKVVRTEETRFYFDNDRLLRWLDEKGEQVSLTTDEAKQKRTDYLETSSKFLAGARSKNATIEAE